MKNFLIATASLVASAALFTSTSVNAGVIDFTAGAFSGAQGQSTFSSNGVTLSATGYLPLTNSLTASTLSFNGSVCGNTGVGLACMGDGIGISRAPIAGPFNILLPIDVLPDQINRYEVLGLSFAGPVTITGLEFLNVNRLLNISETMQVRVNGAGAWTSLAPTANQTGGYFASGFSASNVNTLEIRGGNLASDSSLARVAYVPVPATAVLVGLGALFMWNRKKLPK